VAQSGANQARGGISERDLTSTGNPLRKFLFDKPLIEYLEDTEQPHYLFRNDSRGFRVVTPDGDEETPHHYWHSIWTRGHRHLLVTDRRLLYIVGSKGGDDIAEFNYDDITTVTGNQGILTSTLTFTDTDGREFTFAARKGKYGVAEAAEYIQQRLDGVPVAEETTSEVDTCRDCGLAIEPDDKFCSECGTDVHMSICPECESSFEDDPNFCPECGYDLETEDSSVAVQGVGASYFAAVMLLWGSAYSYTVFNRPTDAGVLFVFAVLIIPQVRRQIVEDIKHSLGLNLATGLVQGLVMIVYGILVGAMGLLMIGSAASDPTMSAWSGVGAIFVAAIVAKMAIRASTAS